jgi:hypothetical protein
MIGVLFEDPFNSAEVHGQPNRRFVLGRPRHPMGPVSGDQDMVARTQVSLAFALDAQTRRTGQEQDPFVIAAGDAVDRRASTDQSRRSVQCAHPPAKARR